MDAKQIKELMDKEGLSNNALSIDRNHRVDLYLSDVLERFSNLLNEEAYNKGYGKGFEDGANYLASNF